MSIIHSDTRWLSQTVTRLLALGLLLTGCSAPQTGGDDDTDSPIDDTDSPIDDTDDTDGDTDAVADCEPGLKIGECLPDFTLIGPGEENLSLASYWGDVVFISSGAMW
jgi:hypothetical protein